MINVFAAEFRMGNAVIALHEGAIRYGHVVSVPENFLVPAGQVPVMFDDEENCFVLIPTDDLKLRFPL